VSTCEQRCGAVLLRVSVSVRVVHESVVASLAAEVEGDAIVLLRRNGLLGADFHAADRVLHHLSHLDPLFDVGLASQGSRTLGALTRLASGRDTSSILPSVIGVIVPIPVM
jgi:hypothetical protein